MLSRGSPRSGNAGWQGKEGRGLGEGAGEGAAPTIQKPGVRSGEGAAWPMQSADSALPATLYKFCIILAMNSFLRSQTDSSKGKEGLEAGRGRGRGKMHPKSLTWVQKIVGTGRPR